MLAERGPELAAAGMPLFVVDAGDLGWKSAVVPANTVEQQRQKLDLQLSAFALAGLDGWTPGEGDLALGIEAVQAAVRAHEIPALAANLRCGDQAPFPAARVAQRGGVRLGIVGLIDPDLVDASTGCRAEPVGPALAAALGELGQVDGLVVLSHLASDGDSELVASLPQGALVVNGHGRLNHSTAVSLGSGAVQLAAGSRGKALGLAEVSFAEGGVGFAGTESTGVERRLERYRERLDKAREALASDSSDPRARSRAERQVEFYEGEIAELEARLAAAASDATVARHGVKVTLVQLGDEVADEPATQALVEQAKARLGEATVAAGVPQDQPAGKIAYAGSQACQSCHQAEHAQWLTTPHAAAWGSLVKDGRHLDQACWQCHATGAFDSQGPQHPLQVGPPLQGVGCESCHGPGRAHIAEPVAGNVVLDPPQALCVQCHDGEQDEGRFDWESYRPKVVHAAAE